MGSSQDISSIIAGWDFDPTNLKVRLVRGDDGSEKIQMRIDLGLLQMELSGRPDGQRPEGMESWLEYHEARAEQAAARGEDFSLDHDECVELMREGLQYYHRYLSAFHLERYDIVARDTERNLRLFAFVVQHAVRQRDKVEFDRYRPYVSLMRARALGLDALRQEDYETALSVIDQGIEQIRQFLRDYKEEGRESECSELADLLRFRRDVERQRPVGPITRLEEQLSLAVSQEKYEEAARLRDQIRELRGAVARPDYKS
jgi:hypothetical protein